jgi:AcrR family transcriptional regulator
METQMRPAGGRRRAVPRAEQVQRNRRDLLAAARQVFRDVGYSRASIDAIAEAAGFTKGAVYSHFDSKADLFLSLLEDRIEERRQLQREAVERVVATGELAEFFRGVYRASRDDAPWRLAVLEFRVVAARDDELNARYAAAHRQTFDGVKEAMERVREDFGVDYAVSIDLLVRAALSLDTGGHLEELVEPGSMSDDDLSDLFCRMAGLAGRAARPEEAQR